MLYLVLFLKDEEEKNIEYHNLDILYGRYIIMCKSWIDFNFLKVQIRKIIFANPQHSVRFGHELKWIRWLKILIFRKT